MAKVIQFPNQPRIAVNKYMSQMSSIESILDKQIMRMKERALFEIELNEAKSKFLIYGTVIGIVFSAILKLILDSFL